MAPELVACVKQSCGVALAGVTPGDRRQIMPIEALATKKELAAAGLAARERRGHGALPMAFRSPKVPVLRMQAPIGRMMLVPMMLLFILLKMPMLVFMMLLLMLS